jgi:hypothetical protein
MIAIAIPFNLARWLNASVPKPLLGSSVSMAEIIPPSHRWIVYAPPSNDDPWLFVAFKGNAILEVIPCYTEMEAREMFNQKMLEFGQIMEDQERMTRTSESS